MAESYYQGAYTGAEIDAAIGKVGGVEAGAQANVQSDWNQTDTAADDFIKNKPTLGTAASKGVDSTPTASSTNLVTSGGVAAALAAKINTADVDDALSSTSTNPVQNKAVQAPLGMLVDNGAKNLFNQSESYALDNVSNDNGVYTTAGDTITTLRFQIVKYLNGSRVQDLVTQSITSNGVYYWEFTKDSSFDSFTIGHNGSTYNGRFKYNLGRLKNGRNYVIRIDITRCSDSNGSFQWRDIMICTSEYWAISHEFVPYAPTNRELYEMILAMQNGGNS